MKPDDQAAQASSLSFKPHAAVVHRVAAPAARTCELLRGHHLHPMLQQAAPPAAAGRALLPRASARGRRRGRLSVRQARQQIPGGDVLLVTGHESREGPAGGRIRVGGTVVSVASPAMAVSAERGTPRAASSSCVAITAKTRSEVAGRLRV